MPESYWTVELGLLGWALLFFTLWYTNRKEDALMRHHYMDRMTRRGYPPPGVRAKEVCKKYRSDGPTPCEWPNCSCTKGMTP